MQSNLHPQIDVRDFVVLLLGRLLGGIATSLLFSVFDAWLIRSHANAGLDKVRFPFVLVVD